MRRFIVTFVHEGRSSHFEGILFSTQKVVLECDPGAQCVCSREFSHLAIFQRYITHVLNEFGHASIRWLDEETPSFMPLTQDTPHEPYPYCCPKHYPLPEKPRGEKK
jgi:hypothetical protein